MAVNLQKKIILSLIKNFTGSYEKSVEVKFMIHIISKDRKVNKLWWKFFDHH